MACHNGCRTPCNCQARPPAPTVTLSDGTQRALAPPSGQGQRLCTGIAGGQASLTLGGLPAPIPGGGTGFIRINVTNYNWLKPEKMTTAVSDPGFPGVNPSASVRVITVQAIGRQVIGSPAGINSQSIDSQSQNALYFGTDIPRITAANFIDITVLNLAALPLNISADVEGEASQ